MSTSRDLLVRLARTLVYLAIVGMVIALSAIVASRITIAQLRAMLPAEMLSAGAAPAQMAPSAANAEAQLVTGPIPGTVELDLYAALGLSQAEFVELLAANPHLRIGNAYTLAMTIGNGGGDHLAEGDVILRWDGGQMVQHIGVSGVLAVRVSRRCCPACESWCPRATRCFAKRRCRAGLLTSRTSRLTSSTCRMPRERLPIVSDTELTTRLRQALVKIRDARSSLDGATLLGQLREADASWRWMRSDRLSRTSPRCSRRPRFINSEAIRSWWSGICFAMAITRRRRASWCIHRSDRDGLSCGMNKSTAVARAVMLADGRAFPVVEVLAADMAHEWHADPRRRRRFAASPIAMGDGAGTPVTVIRSPRRLFL
ncbi:MAG: hypothetical protein R3C99_12645 [Pirellulaceae bacterium]